MTKKQQKKLAKQFAELEFKLQHATEDEEIRLLENKIIALTESTQADMDFADMDAVDAMVREMLREKNS